MDDRESHGSIQPINILKAIFKGSPPTVFSKKVAIKYFAKIFPQKTILQTNNY